MIAHGAGNGERPAEGSRWGAWAPWLLALLGLLLALRVPLATGFERLHGDEGDVRHLNYVLEHSFLWATGAPNHSSFWSPPVFFPEPNTGAYSETLVGLLPLYAPLRLARVSPEVSFQVVLAGALLSTYWAGYALFRRGFGAGRLGSSAGAYLFAFAGPRIQKLHHAQLLAHAFTALAVLALIQAFRSSREGRSRGTTGWLAVFFGSCVAQVYVGVYLGWFLGFGLLLALLAGLAGRTDRANLIAFARRSWPGLAAGAFLALLAGIPLATAYLGAASDVGTRSFEMVAPFLPPLKAWLNPGPTNVFYGGWLGSWGGFGRLPFSWEKQLFPGAVTLAAVAWGAWRERRSPAFRICALSGVAMVLLATSWPGGHTLWRYVLELLPGADAIRAVPRLVLILLIPAGAALSAAVDAAAARSRILAASLVLFVGAEQLQALPSFEVGPVRQRVAAVRAAIPEGCTAFFYSPVLSGKPFWETQLDAMWASIERGVPTVNGYSSNLPRGWEPLMAHELSFFDEPRVRTALTAWLEASEVSPETVCWVQLAGGKAGNEGLSGSSR